MFPGHRRGQSACLDPRHGEPHHGGWAYPACSRPTRSLRRPYQDSSRPASRHLHDHHLLPDHPPRLPASSLNHTQTSEEGRSTIQGATLFKHVRRRPTLPRSPPRSTIGAEGLNFRVRNGTGCFPFAITAVTLLRCHRPREACCVHPGDEPLKSPDPPKEARPHLGNRTVDAKQEYGVEAKPLGLLVPVSCTRCRASTSGLSTQ